MFTTILKRLGKRLKRLGPGFITGAADDDPSGVATYSIAGAQFGYRLNWLSLFLIPMMYSIQEMCARIGMVSGKGLAGVIKKYYSKKLLIASVLLLAVANIINLGADLGIMAASLQMVLGQNFLFWIFVVTIFTVILEVFVPYKQYFPYLKILGFTLLVYVVTAFLTKQNWIEIFKATVIPNISFKSDYLMTMVGFIGTTISPYLFFWQASEEVEEEIESGEVKDFNKKPHIKLKEIMYMREDTIVGMIFSNIISAFIILTTAATLNAHGITNIETPQQAALALKPLAGNFAFFLFSIGMIGIGLQSVPILAGSVAYAFSEAFNLKEGLGKTLSQAKAFYIVLAMSIVVGASLNLLGINPIKALFYSAIINGLISVPLIAIIIRIADNPKVVGEYKTSKINKIIGIVTLIFVTLSSLLMIFNIF